MNKYDRDIPDINTETNVDQRNIETAGVCLHII